MVGRRHWTLPEKTDSSGIVTMEQSDNTQSPQHDRGRISRVDGTYQQQSRQTTDNGTIHGSLSAQRRKRCTLH